MAEQELVTMQAYDRLTDPVAGNVDPADEETGGVFETTPELAEQYRKAQWAGPTGRDPRDIQLEVARDQLEKRNEAKRFATSSRQALHNISGDAAAKGYSGAENPQPQSRGAVEALHERRTNQQIVGGEEGEASDESERQVEETQEGKRQSRKQKNTEATE